MVRAMDRTTEFEPPLELTGLLNETPSSLSRRLRRTLIRRGLKWLLQFRDGRRSLSGALPPSIRYVTYAAEDHLITFDPHEVRGRLILADGSWLREDTELALEVLSKHGKLEPGKVALEVGANIGTQSLYLALSGRFKSVIAVEPEPGNLELLRMNVTMNKMDDRIRVVAGAVGDTDGTAKLLLSGRNSGAHSLDIDGSRPCSKSIEVRVLSPESVLREAQVAAEDVGFVWMDVEGLEDRLAPALVAVVGSRVPVFLEYSPEMMGSERTSIFTKWLFDTYNAIYQFRKTGGDPVRIGDPGDLRAVDQCDLLVYSV